MNGPSPQHEVHRAQSRRRELLISRPLVPDTAPPDPLSQWGLAFSGGGIRSATFCLGVAQALARSDTPGTRSPEQGRPRPLLMQFDYLSTVSGGGYIGGFISSLCVPGRLDDPDEARHTQHVATPQAQRLAVTRSLLALQEEPPGRIRRQSRFNPDRPGETALAWLRDNGRYMAPSGAGDLLYGITVALRNWFATQYVMGTLIVLVLAALQALRWGLSSGWPTWQSLECEWLVAALAEGGTLIWWSPSWLWPGVWALLLTVPLGLAYWFTHPAHARARRQEAGERGHLESPPAYWTQASGLGLALALGFTALSAVATALARPPLSQALGAAGGCTWLAVLVYWASVRYTRTHAPNTITRQRVTLTRWLSWSLQWGLVLVSLAAVETVAQTGWLWLSMRESAVLSGGMGLAVWALKEFTQRLNDKPQGASALKLPLGLIAGVVGAALWVTVAAFIDVLLLKVAWPGGWANPAVLERPDDMQLALGYALGALGVSAVLAAVVGCFPGFLNLSTLQSLYSARLIRAYLGASNPRRFSRNATPESRDVAEPIEGDSLSVQDIYANPLAPVHFVNVCVNQSVSPGEQLLQRDRKGKPLVLAPGGAYFDQSAHALHGPGEGTELSQPLSFGEWLGVSGAAFSTGLGRGTGLGMSLALGFANVRLGRWWHGLGPAVASPASERASAAAPASKTPWLTWLLPTQSYLLDELTGRFYGSHRPFLYLSDGGHFENTAVFELLRLDRPRQVRLIVVCDCGCDPDYRFDDLANLMRLVRIDHGLEVRVNETVTGVGQPLAEVFTTPQAMARQADGTLRDLGQRCAVLLDVVGTERSAPLGVAPGALHARIVLIKPRLMSDAPMDLVQYRATHSAFPQETTMDQFFDEAQWESYRQLGLRSGLRVFEGDGSEAYRQALWRALLQGLPPDAPASPAS